jgi:DNA polymerase-3 subunit beta
VADRLTPVQLEFRRDVVVIEARSSGRARAVESLPAKFDGEEHTISFNPQYLLDGITAAALGGHARPPTTDDPDGAVPAGAGAIRLQFSSPAKPALISWIDGDATAGQAADQVADAASFRYLVVPLRVPVVG